MGNCSLKGVAEKQQRCSKSIRILMDSGGILEFKCPVIVKNIIAKYPGYGVFQQGHASMPLLDEDVLVPGRLYYLLPLDEDDIKGPEVLNLDGVVQEHNGSECVTKNREHEKLDGGKSPKGSERMDGSNENVYQEVDEIEVQSNKEVDSKQVESEDERKSTSSRSSGFVENLGNDRSVEVLPQTGDGVWRVKLVITTRQLEEILAEEGNTEALIEKMRMAAAANASTPRRLSGAWGAKLKPALNYLFRNSSDDGRLVQKK